MRVVWMGMVLGACASGDGNSDKDAPTDGTGTTSTDPTTTTEPPPGGYCQYAGPDAPVLPAIEPVISDFEGFPLLVHVPENARGVLWYFHGGADVGEFNGTEQDALKNLLLEAGIGYVATQRTLPGGGDAWDAEGPISGNDDMQRLIRLRDHLITTTNLREDTPILSSGFSDGAKMSLYFATRARNELGWPIVVALPHNSGNGELPDVPVMWTVAEHDDRFTTGGAEELYAEQLDRGYAADLAFTEERVVTEESLLRVPDWDAEKVVEVFDDLVAFGLIDDAGVRVPGDDQMEGALTAYGQQSLLRGSAMAESRVRVLWATHRYSAYDAGRECTFALEAMGLL